MFKSNISNVNKFASPITCRDQYGKFTHKKSCTYPIEYIVTDDLQEIASEYRKKMEKESLAIAETHDLQTTIQQFEDIYSELISR